MATLNIKDQLLAMGMEEHEISAYRSDLQFLVTPISEKYVANCKEKVSKFISRIDGKPWYDIPFGYMNEFVQNKRTSKVVEEEILKVLLFHGNFAGYWYDGRNYYKIMDDPTKSVTIVNRAKVIEIAKINNVIKFLLEGEAKFDIDNNLCDKKMLYDLAWKHYEASCNASNETIYWNRMLYEQRIQIMEAIATVGFSQFLTNDEKTSISMRKVDL